MIIHRKSQKPKSSGSRRTILWSSLASIVLLFVFALIGKLTKSRDIVDPLYRQYVQIGSGLAMLLACAFLVRKQKENVEAVVVRNHLIFLTIVAVSAIAALVLLGLKSDFLGNLMVQICGVLLILGVAMPQSLTKLK